MKKSINILMICSWLEPESFVGNFFREQAELLPEPYNIHLVRFKRRELGLRTLIKQQFNLFSFHIHNSNKRNKEIYVTYAEFWFLPLIFNNYLKYICLRRFLVFLRNEKISYQLIHAQSIFDAGFWAYDLSKIESKKFIITEHNQLTFANKSINEYIKVKEILNAASLNCVVSNDKIRQFATNGIFGSFRNVGNAVNQSIFHPIKVSKNENCFTITTIGAFSPIKNQETILRSLKILDNHPISSSKKIQFHWIGFDGWGESNITNVKNLVSTYNIRNIEIILSPTLPRTEIAKHLNESDVFIFSSIAEGMPVSVLEALACGTPVVSTNCGGVDEIIDLKNGRIVQIFDAEGIASILLKIIEKELIFDRNAIHADATIKFGEKKFIRDFSEIYSNLITLS